MGAPKRRVIRVPRPRIPTERDLPTSSETADDDTYARARDDHERGIVQSFGKLDTRRAQYRKDVRVAHGAHYGYGREQRFAGCGFCASACTCTWASRSTAITEREGEGDDVAYGGRPFVGGGATYT